MAKAFDLQDHLNAGIERIVNSAVKATLKNPKESAFMLKFARASKAAEKSAELAPGDERREYLESRLSRLREQFPEMVFITFPGDEKSSDGCIAAGRGFFHINSYGGAEPCPFSPFSDINVKEATLKQALDSPLFTALRSGGILLDDHEGGCVLYNKRAEVEKIINSGRQAQPLEK